MTAAPRSTGSDYPRFPRIVAPFAVGDVPEPIKELVAAGLTKRWRSWDDVGFVATVAIEPDTQISPLTDDLAGSNWLVVLEANSFLPGSVVSPAGDWSYVVSKKAISAAGARHLYTARVYEKAALAERQSD